jgi:hypothetical protein
MAAAAAKVGLAGITLASGTATFLMFIHEEAVQTIMMAQYVAHKNKLHDRAKHLIKVAAEKYIFSGAEFTANYGILAPYAVHSFKTYWASALEMLQVYADFYDVDISADAKKIRNLLDRTIVDVFFPAQEDPEILDINVAEEMHESKDYSCNVLAFMEHKDRTPRHASDIRMFEHQGRKHRFLNKEILGDSYQPTPKGVKECDRRRRELKSGTLLTGAGDKAWDKKLADARRRIGK